MKGLIRHLATMGVAAGLAALAPRALAAQENQTGDTSAVQPSDTGLQNPSGYQGMARDTGVQDSALQDTASADSVRIRPTDSTGAAAGEGADSALAGDDSAGVVPGDPSAIRPSTPAERMSPVDSAGPDSPTEGP
jgi:hypothetical protein